MTIRDGDIPTIFNPASTANNSQIGGRGRTPSVVITTEGCDQAITASNGQPGSNAGTPPPSATHTQYNHPPFSHTDSVTSHGQDTSSLTGVIGATSGGIAAVGGIIQHGSPTGGSRVPSGRMGCMGRLKGCSDSLCSTSARKIYFGIWVTVCMTASWVGATHCIKYLYLDQAEYHSVIPPAYLSQSTEDLNITALQPIHGPNFQAPFCTTWFMTNWTMLFFPLYFIARLTTTRCTSPIEILVESIRDFRDKGFTAGRFLTRCSLFCILWVGTNYMYVRSLRILLATDVMALFATNVSCAYLLSWVILHEQFVGIRIMAVIMCDTGVALLAYMDGITGSPTLGGVVLAASAAAGSAVYKVLFKKVIGDATYGQVALFFSIIGMLNAALLWPLCLTLVLTGVETLHWERLPWPALLTASALFLVANLLGNFSVALTYDLFITLGLITAVPVSAALDVVLYGAQFEGMKLAGMILISVGFFLVMFPDNWPDYITRLLRNIIMLSHSARWSRRNRHGASGQQRRDAVDYRTGYIRSHLRSPSGRVR